MSELNNDSAPDDSSAIDQEPDTGAPPKNIRTTRRIGERLYVAGQGPKPATIMFLATSVLEEEAAETQFSQYGRRITQKPRYLKGAPGAIFTDIAQMCGIDMRQCYYTAMIKWLLPKAHRDKPKKDEIAWAVESLENEIREVKPEIIVTLGKPPFDFLTNLKVPLKDIKGAWFRCDRFNCRVFPMEKVTLPVTKPEYTEKFRVELLEVRKMLSAIEGNPVIEVTRQYTVTENMQQVSQLVEMWDNNRFNIQSVDCEWGGNNHVDGRLRSIQFCWAPGFATYLKFRDEKAEYVFDAPYDEVGAKLGIHLNKPEVKYVGHHIAADFPWMDACLGLEWYDKCIMDTEFGQQCVDEYEELGLERMSIKYTDLGRYDIDLMLWNKKNKGDATDGYAFVPDSIIIPYGCADVDVPFRTYPQILAAMAKQKGLMQYFYKFFLPFVSNVFTQFALTGLPMNKARMDELRELFSWARDEMNVLLQRKVTKEADQLMLSALVKADPVKGVLAYPAIMEQLQQGQPDQAFHILKTYLGIDKLKDLQVFLDHRVDAPNFNIRSTDQMRRWLFDVKKLTPIKSTNRKEQGLPSMAWEKVMSYPPEKQKEFAPSTDKQTLEILGQHDSLIGELLELNAVGNIVKAFLKEPTIDEETGELTKENGLHFWLAQDGRIHGQLSTTETGRPRAWRPNFLNWPSFVNKKIEGGIAKLLKQKHEEGMLPPKFAHYLKDKVPSIRSCVDVQDIPPLPGSLGWCLVESDFKTAEVRGLAYISGDENMIRMFEEPDQQFGLLRVGNTGNDEDDLTPIRLKYADDCGIPLEKQDHRMILHNVTMRKVNELAPADIPEGQQKMEAAFLELKRLEAAGKAIPCDGKTFYHLEFVNPAKLERNPDGTLRHPDFDFHWNLAEMVNHKPREILIKKIHRAAGKVGNFCIAEGELVETQRGPVAIQNVRSCDLLWDGVEWVSHEGVVCTGVKEVHLYGGLWATDNHEVWTVEQGKVSFGQARAQCLELVRPTRSGGQSKHRNSAGLHEEVSRGDLHGTHSARVSAGGVESQAAVGSPSTQRQSSRTAKVYDIVNVGPRHRFVCMGVLVSNSSAYGATADTLERKVEADTGAKPEPGTGQALLDALAARQPVAVGYLKAVERYPEEPGYYQANSGRYRHFRMHPENLYAISSRMRQSILSALGREMRNFPFQTSVADTATKAANSMMLMGRQQKLHGVIMVILYDSIVTLCPVEERFIWEAAHDLYMRASTGWEYHDRILRYPIDTEFNRAWSTSPTKEWKAKLYDKTFAPTPVERQPLLDWIKSEITRFDSDPKLSL